MFDGLDMHIYTLAAAPFVAELLSQTDLSAPTVRQHSAYIQGAFLFGWALGGGLFGRLGDWLGRSRTLSLTVLTYAAFTGLSFFAHTWWQLLIFRFLSALGIGGEWAVGASLLVETWPKRWRPWIAAVLQTGVNIGVLFACLAFYLFAGLPSRYVFLVGVIPAGLVFYIRRNVPEPEEWREAKAGSAAQPGVLDLFRGEVLRVTLLTVTVCALTLTGWWAFMFWQAQFYRGLSELAALTEPDRNRLVSEMFFLVIGVSCFGNFFAAWLARRWGYRKTISFMFLCFFFAIAGAFWVPRSSGDLFFWLPAVGFFSGVFGLFTMYLPPLFPVLLRTTGAGFCYNIGRIAAAGGTIFFALYFKVADLRHALFFDGFLFLPAAAVALLLPDLSAAEGGGAEVEPVE
jgi:predicted MFS family arabinose efflux permease